MAIWSRETVTAPAPSGPDSIHQNEDAGTHFWPTVATMNTTRHAPNVDIVTNRATADPHGACIQDGIRTLDNTAFARSVAGLAQRFGVLGVIPGDTVAAMLPNCAEMVITMFAAWSVGAALTPVNPALTDDEVLYQLQDSGSVLLVGDQRAASLAEASDTRYMLADSIFATSSDIDTTDPSQSPTTASAPQPRAARADDFALVIYTSGTTGRPKGVLLDHANLSAMSTSLIEQLRLSAADTSLLVLPLFHTNGLVVSVLSTLRAGGNVVIAPSFSVGTFWDLVETHRPTYFSAVPTIYALLQAHTTRRVDTSSLRFAICGAAPMPPELITTFEQQFSIPIVEGYGLSEGTVASTLNPVDGPRKPGTVGITLPGQELAIMDAHGVPLPAGTPGEVVIRGANVMRGYLGQPDVTATVVRDGWLHTGDVGYFDSEGYLILVDRIKDMIIRGGENIYPKEIEDVLYRHPGVLEAAVVGAPDPVMGEVPVAYVAPRPGAALTTESLTVHCARALAKYKQPHEIRIVTSLPKNSVGKIVKRLLRDDATS